MLKITLEERSIGEYAQASRAVLLVYVRDGNRVELRPDNLS